MPDRLGDKAADREGVKSSLGKASLIQIDQLHPMLSNLKCLRHEHQRWMVSPSPTLLPTENQCLKRTSLLHRNMVKARRRAPAEHMDANAAAEVARSGDMDDSPLLLRSRITSTDSDVQATHARLAWRTVCYRRFSQLLISVHLSLGQPTKTTWWS